MAALKLLADNFASDSHVRDRFQREARVASERNHPNICTVYDIGQKSSSTKFLTEAAAFALGADGDFADAGKLAHELEQKYPLDTSVQNYIVRPFAHRTSCTRDGPRELSANFVNGALAHVQLARADASSCNMDAARTEYQNFLTRWRDADPDRPILRQAKAEYAKLA